MPTLLAPGVMKRRRKRIIYLLRDEFVTAQAAPLPSPRTCQPGPGQLLKRDSGDKSSISNGKLIWTSAVATWDPYWTGSTLFGALAGRAFLFSIQVNVGRAQIGVQLSANPFGNGDRRGAFDFNLAGLLQVVDNTLVAITLGNYTIAAGIPYKVAIVQQPTILGNKYFLQGDIFSQNTLLWLDTAKLAETTDRTPMAGAIGVTSSAEIDYVRVRNLGGAFAMDYGIATLHILSPVSDTPATGEANGISDLFFTLPAGSANLIAVELRYRRQDATNYWTAYIKRNAGNTAWDLYLDSVAAGTPTNRLTVTGVGTPDCIRVIHDGSNHDCYTRATTTWTKRGGQVVNAALAAQPGVDPIAGAGTTLSQLDVWARTSTLYNVLDQV